MPKEYLNDELLSNCNNIILYYNNILLYLYETVIFGYHQLKKKDRVCGLACQKNKFFVNFFFYVDLIEMMLKQAASSHPPPTSRILEVSQ